MTIEAISPPAASYTAFGLRAEAERIEPGLHLVATPIGNLKDVSFRALSTLAAADAVVAEDTRVTKTLLAHYGISTPLVAYHEHNARVIRPHLLARLEAGAKLALVSDAGTPLVSDPGFRLVQEALEKGVHVTSVPGPSAVLAALVVAGLPTDRFFFEGFLPHKSGPRRARLAELAPIPGTLVFFESPRRLAETLADCAAILGKRNAAIARELTKMFESVRRGTLDELAATLAEEEPPKGRNRAARRPARRRRGADRGRRSRRQNRRGADRAFGEGRGERRFGGDGPAAPTGLCAGAGAGGGTGEVR